MRTFTYGMATLIGIRVWKTKGCSLTSATSSESSYPVLYQLRGRARTLKPSGLSAQRWLIRYSVTPSQLN
jgi:hypothetical protein